MNPLLNGSMTQKFQQIGQAIKTIKNPQEAINNLLANNPNIQQVNEVVQKYGSPENAFNAIARQMGYDPVQLMNMLK